MSKRLFFALSILVMAALLAACAPAAPAQQPYVRQISASGSGRVYLTPDVAYVNISVNTKSEKVADALKDNNTLAQAVASALKEMGVEEKDIQTTAFNVYPQQEFGPNGEVTRNLYMVDNTVYVTVRDLTKLGQLLDAAVRAGANNINGIQFDVLDKEKAMAEARRMAVENARKQAEELAAVAGVQLGALQSLNVYVSNPPVPVYEGKARGGDMSASSVPVSAGQMVISIDANLSYEIK